MFIIVGTTTLDLCVQSEELFFGRADDGFKESNLLFCERPLTMRLGGNGGGSAYVLAALGEAVTLCSGVGEDIPGRLLTAWLAAKNVNMINVVRSHELATSTSTIIMAHAASQRVFHHLGATAAITAATFSPGLAGQADVFFITGLPLLISLTVKETAEMLAEVRAAGTLTALDIGPAVGRPVTLTDLASLLPSLDYLIGNEHELMVAADETGGQTAAAKLLSAGANNVVIKRGDRGAAIQGKNGPADWPGFPVEAQNSIGAGDSFNAGFLYGLQQNWPVDKALKFGCAVAAMVVSGRQGVLGAPSRPAVEAFLTQQASVGR